MSRIIFLYSSNEYDKKEKHEIISYHILSYLCCAGPSIRISQNEIDESNEFSLYLMQYITRDIHWFTEAENCIPYHNPYISLFKEKGSK